ncbi:hypothetical protein [Variovorax sp. DXTD-1]|uniref:hypothetical protein n=1 Tax=Variovorax sp. DXTD-1 TaxID=2495592 RepID=UPI000F89CB36|nr:hypothetical protein [Variovorax sp. DXTD-1]RST44211.1 hypothetical protein EJI00_24825 [Variovorax sp. DXTD-1]
MKLRTPLAALSLALGIASVNTSAQAQVPDPCTLYLCMASISGQGTPPGNCSSAIAYWHIPAPGGLAIYSYNPAKFLSQPSYNYRKQYMNSCSGATNTPNNSNIFDTITNQWGDKE